MRKRQARHQKIASKSRRRRHAAHAAHDAHAGGSGRITGDTTVYVASAGWRDSDVSMQVIGLDKAVVSKIIHEMMKYEAQRAHGADEDLDYDYGKGLRFGTTDDALNEIAFYGIHKFALKDIVPQPNDLRYVIREIGAKGYSADGA